MPMVDLLLRDVAPTTKATLDAQCRSRTFASGEQLVAWDAMPDRLYHLVSGRAKVWRPGIGGHSVILYFLPPGETAGLIAMCRGRPGTTTITAVGPTVTKSWPSSLIRRLLRDDPQMAMNALSIVANWFELLADRIEDMASGRADQQLARALLRLAGEDGQWNDVNEATVAVTRQDLADMTRSTLHTASRTLSGWASRHWVQSSRGRVTITDPTALAKVAGLHG